MKKTMFSMGCVVALGLGLALSWSSPSLAQGIKLKPKPSDRTVRVIMGWAFAAVPPTVKRSGKEIKLDRSNPKDFYIPLEDARRIIRVATRSANADLCGLKKMETRNFLKLMSNEKSRKKWTPNQMTFIHQLHIATGLIITGTGTAGDDPNKKDDGSNDVRRNYKCSPEERERLQASIETYLKQSVTTQ